MSWPKHAAVRGGREGGAATQYLTREDLASIAVYLQSVGAQADAAPVVPQATIVAASERHPNTLKLRAGAVDGAGAMIYLNNCNACRRSSGAGASGVLPSLAGDSVVNAKDPTSLIRAVLAGSAMPSTEKHPSALAMPGFAWRLADADVAALLSFLRSIRSNGAEAVTAAQVATVRNALPAGAGMVLATQPRGEARSK